MIAINKPLFQSMSPDDCKLQKNCVDIWQFSLANLPDNARSLLNDEEQTRADRFYFARHQRRFTVARAMTRRIIGRYLNSNPELLHFTYNQYGKPSVTNTQQLEFNLSHSKDLALLAIGQTFPLGIDLEFFSKRPYQGIGEYLFSPQESQALSQLAKPIEALGFFHIWAQKEAFIKANGMGLAYPTQQFSVPTLPVTNKKIHDPLHNKWWKIISFMPKITCCAALCCDLEITVLRRINLDNWHELL